MPAPLQDLLITAIETNSHHGVGILLQRFFPDSSGFVCLRSASQHQGAEPFGSAHHELPSRFLTVSETEEQLRRILAPYPVRRILCVPYYREDFIHAVLAHRITGAPLCTYLMDDQNVFAPHIPDHWVADLLAASDLCLGISPEMCAAYQRKFHRPVHLLPPVLGRSQPVVPSYWVPEPGQRPRAAMIGNVWTARRFDQLRALLRNSDLEVDWYGNGPAAAWLTGTPEDWETDQIRCMGFLPEDDLVAALASYPFVIVPSGSLEADDDNPAFSRLSLPSRLLFLHAATDVPVLVLGHEDTAAGRFVRQLGTGVCAPYDAASLMGRIQPLLEPASRREFQHNIRHWSRVLALEDAGQWIWASLAARAPQPAAFHAAFPAGESGGARWLESIPPAQPPPSRRHPQAGESFREEHAASFAFLRARHLPVLAASGLDLPPADALEVSHFQVAAAHFILREALPKGGHILFLGPAIPAGLQSLPAGFKLWRVADLEQWQQAGYAGEVRHVMGAATGTAYPAVFPQFDAIVSTGWCGQLGTDPHPLEGLSLYLEACTRSGGFNLHFFSAVLHPGYFWTGPAHGYLQRRFLGAADWPGLDELLAADDLFTMSQAAYDTNWKQATGKSYADSGRPLALGLYWRKA